MGRYIFSIYFSGFREKHFILIYIYIYIFAGILNTITIKMKLYLQKLVLLAIIPFLLGWSITPEKGGVLSAFKFEVRDDKNVVTIVFTEDAPKDEIIRYTRNNVSLNTGSLKCVDFSDPEHTECEIYPENKKSIQKLSVFKRDALDCFTMNLYHPIEACFSSNVDVQSKLSEVARSFMKNTSVIVSIDLPHPTRIAGSQGFNFAFHSTTFTMEFDNQACSDKLQELKPVLKQFFLRGSSKHLTDLTCGEIGLLNKNINEITNKSKIQKTSTKNMEKQVCIDKLEKIQELRQYGPGLKKLLGGSYKNFTKLTAK
jgi:hypothetical protein